MPIHNDVNTIQDHLSNRNKDVACVIQFQEPLCLVTKKYPYFIQNYNNFFIFLSTTGGRTVAGNPGYLQITFYDLSQEKPVCKPTSFYGASGKNGRVDLMGMVLDANKNTIKVRCLLKDMA